MNTNGVTTHDAPALLVLEDGTAYRGRSVGAAGTRLGEAVFNTSMTGYQEILTDPSYRGQIVAMTAPHIGNYGVRATDVESPRAQAEGFVMREACGAPSSWRAEGSLPAWLRAQGVVAIDGIDTRGLVRRLRSAGAMRAGIWAAADGMDAMDLMDTLLEQVRALAPMEGQNLVHGDDVHGAGRAATAGAESNPGRGAASGASRRRVGLVDYGAKSQIGALLVAEGFVVERVAPDADAAAILAARYDGVVLSNGPGDPAALGAAIDTARAVVRAGVPTFGICLGHQVLALALGARTYKLKFGHRGGNHPVKDLRTGRVAITSQNHGFCVDAATLPADVAVTHTNLYDDTVAGLRHTTLPAFGVQYHPEAGPGPHDARALFAEFRALVEARG